MIRERMGSHAVLLGGVCCLVFGQAPPAPVFEAASIKVRPFEAPVGPGGAARVFMLPGRFEFVDPQRVEGTNLTVPQLIREAYDVHPYQILGPVWMDETRFDLQAKADAGSSREQLREMLQALLRERFGLVAHRETRRLPRYELVIGKSGPKLRTVDVETAKRNAWKEVPRQGREDVVQVFGSPGDFAARLSHLQPLVVVDHTGLTGTYEFKVEMKKNERLEGALMRQLGLRLKSSKGPVEVLVVDQLREKPTEN